MPPTKATVTYKKKDGSLTVADDRKYLFWTPSAPPGASPSVTVPVADITNLQQTPAENPKVALKVVVGEDSYIFSFTSRDAARKEQEAVTDTLRNAIAAQKAKSGPQLASAAESGSGTPLAAANGDGDPGQSAAMAIAKAVSAKPQDEGWYSDVTLKSDFQLQRSLLQSNKALNDRFQQALRDKPESVSAPQFTAQFWSTRLHLLRAHAIEKTQKEGDYNVLPEIRFETIYDDQGQPMKKLNMTKEQVGLIFKQYPVVRQAFNETVPRPYSDPVVFWQKFFASKLLKKLKGLRLEKSDPSNPVLDRYLEYQESRGPASIAQIPHFIDLEGNEQNTKFHLEGDYEMRAGRHDRPILHLLNQMSEKLLSHVAPEDGEAHAPIGMDESTFEQLRLRDLALQESDNRVVLNVREPQRYHRAPGDDDLSADAKRYAQQDPTAVLSSLRTALNPSNIPSLDTAVGFDLNSDDEDEETLPDAATNGHKPASSIGSASALTTATATILSSIASRRSHATSEDLSTHTGGLSPSLFDTVTITHSTTTEFLHYFWTLFLSGDSTRATELSQLVSTLDKSLDRINAVAGQAEKERQERIRKMHEEAEMVRRRTGKRRRVDESLAPGGKKVVEEMMGPTVRALSEAVERYRKGWEVQSREAAAAGAGGGG